MNHYQGVLLAESVQKYGKEFGKKYTSDMMKWARKMVAVNQRMASTKAELEMVNDWHLTESILDPSEKRPYALAIMAVIKEDNQDTVTVNLEEVLPQNHLSRNMFSDLVGTLIEVYKVAHPYQLVFLA